jgi:hypothetical protein
VTFITGSISTAGASSVAFLKLADTALRLAMERAVGVVSGNKCAGAESVILIRVFATGKPLKGPRASDADAPEWMEDRIPGNERWAGIEVLWAEESWRERVGWEM